MEKCLKDFAIGEVGVVKALNAVGKTKRKLLDMGITKGACIQLVKFAPLGDPIEIIVRGYKLSLRKDEAEQIIMEDENQ